LAAVSWQWAHTPLQRVANMKYLGVHFHESGSWHHHVAEKVRKGQAHFISERRSGLARASM
jgi:hypothetical protein